MHKRKHPYIANLPDIDSYPGTAPKDNLVEYPKNYCKAEAVFDFNKFCRKNSTFFLSNLFSGKSHEEIRSIGVEEEERYYMVNDDDDDGITVEPIFTSVVPDDDE